MSELKVQDVNAYRRYLRILPCLLTCRTRTEKCVSFLTNFLHLKSQHTHLLACSIRIQFKSVHQCLCYLLFCQFSLTLIMVFFISFIVKARVLIPLSNWQCCFCFTKRSSLLQSRHFPHCARGHDCANR